MMRVRTRCSLALLGALACFVSACSGASETNPMNHSQSSSVGRPEWDAARSRTVFFAHQSVGENILDGLRRIASAEGYPAMTIVETGAAMATGPALWHEKVGQNGDPMSKIKGFTDALNAGAGARADIALMKFCFWDIQKDTDVKSVFSAYKDAMTHVSRQFPNLTLVHTTVPLVVEDTDWKASVRRLLGMPVPTDLDNAAREELNKMIRQEYGSRAALFDIAALEQQTPARAGVPYLAAAYSSDGAHLNDAGRRVVAAGLVKSLAAVSSRVDAGTR